MSRVSSVSCQVKSSSLANKELILIRLNSSWAAEVKTFYCTKTSVRVFFFLPLLVSRCYQGKIDTWKKCTTLVERPKWLPFLQLSAFCTWHLWRPSTHDEYYEFLESWNELPAQPCRAMTLITALFTFFKMSTKVTKIRAKINFVRFARIMKLWDHKKFLRSRIFVETCSRAWQVLLSWFSVN